MPNAFIQRHLVLYRLEHAELQLDETIMAISNYITLHMNSTPAR